MTCSWRSRGKVAASARAAPGGGWRRRRRTSSTASCRRCPFENRAVVPFELSLLAATKPDVLRARTRPRRGARAPLLAGGEEEQRGRQASRGRRHVRAAVRLEPESARAASASPLDALPWRARPAREAPPARRAQNSPGAPPPRAPRRRLGARTAASRRARRGGVPQWRRGSVHPLATVLGLSCLWGCPSRRRRSLARHRRRSRPVDQRALGTGPRPHRWRPARRRDLQRPVGHAPRAHVRPRRQGPAPAAAARSTSALSSPTARSRARSSRLSRARRGLRPPPTPPSSTNLRSRNPDANRGRPAPCNQGLRTLPSPRRVARRRLPPPRLPALDDAAALSLRLPVLR